MTGLLHTCLFSSLRSYLRSRHIIMTLDNSRTISITQFQHLVHQSCDTVCTLDDTCVDIMLCGLIKFHIRCRNNLCKAREHI